jgi:hypothetical protein
MRERERRRKKGRERTRKIKRLGTPDGVVGRGSSCLRRGQFEQHLGGGMMDEHTTRSEKKHTHTKHSRIETLRIPIQDDVHPTPTGGRDYAVFHPEVYPNDGHGAYPIIDFALL